MPSPHQPQPIPGLSIYATETGTTARVKAGRLTVTLEGLTDEAEAERVMAGVLGELAKGRGKLPAKVADRTLSNIVAALEAAP